MHLNSWSFLAAAILLHAPVFALQEAEASGAEQARFFDEPDASAEAVVFVHANDLWRAPRGGGDAIRLTSSEGAETAPHFSPDGKWIAFSGQYGGNTDVYVIPASGGQPERLTWHPGADVAQGWTPDGRVLFRSGRAGHPTQLWKFYTVSLEGGLPEALGTQAFEGEMSASGDWLAFQEIGLWDEEWRNYRGGQAQPISIVSTETWERITPPWEGERQMAPVWLDGRAYYISERSWSANVWSFDPASGEETQHTFHSDFDVKSLGAGAGVVVYEQAGFLHELDPSSGETRQLVVRVAGDLNWARPRWEDVSATQLRDARISPTGKRALFEHRGDLFTVAAKKGGWRNLTRTPGVADRHAAWSPDGQSIAWFNDEGGEYGLVIGDQNGANQRRIEMPDPTFYFVPRWSPDGEHLALTDTDYRVLIVHVETGEVTHVDTDRFAHPERSMNPVWSPDSRYLAYPRRLDNQLRAIIVYDTKEKALHQITDGMADSISPVWGEKGEHLYFLASTDFGLNTGWLDMTSYDRPVTRGLYVALLKEDGESPFLPKSDEEPAPEEDPEEDADEETSEEESDDDGKEDATEGDAAEPAAEEEGADGDEGDDAEDEGEDEDETVEIDFEGLQSRIVDAPGLPLRNYVGLFPAPAGHVFVAELVPNKGAVLHSYKFEDAKVEPFIEPFQAADVSSDRKHMLVRSGPAWKIVGTKGKPSGKEKPLAVQGMRIQVDPRAEWRQMLRDGWRFMRDFLYVDNQHGAPWDEMWEAYSAWLPGVDHRADFNRLLDMLSGEIAVGHSYVVGGDYPDLESPRTGLLGADLEVADGGIRITRLYSGERWTPGLSGPLTHPGLGVNEGDYLVSIDGRAVEANTNPFALLEGTAGRVISVEVASSAAGDDLRKLNVQPVSSENQLRTWAWVAANQRRVDELSDGRLAYVWIPNTGRGGYSYFNRMYFAQQDRAGAVLDERNNGGGSAADYIIDVLSRNLTGYFNSRAGDRKPFTQPMAGLFGPKVMIINERAGSGGDLMPYLFRFQGVGPLIGTRTWGGLVGTWDTPPLIDGGRFVAPRGGFIDVNGEWAVEAEGVAPDIEVRNDPADVMAGRDPQLEAAVAEALRRLETEGVTLKPEPAPPVRWRKR
ncbi:MAG: PDZ domain-containing protein [Planctomycetota bacterium]